MNLYRIFDANEKMGLLISEHTNLTAIPVGLGFLWDFVFLKLKTCSLVYEKLLIQKFNDMITQVIQSIFSASDIMEHIPQVLANPKLCNHIHTYIHSFGLITDIGL